MIGSGAILQPLQTSRRGRQLVRGGGGTAIKPAMPNFYLFDEIYKKNFKQSSPSPSVLCCNFAANPTPALHLQLGSATPSIT
jgi:hypothetical protein